MEQTPLQPNEASLTTVCDVQFRNNSKVYFFDPGNLTIHTGDEVIIETSRGAEFGTCTHGNHAVKSQDVVAPLRPVIRLATAQDRKVNEENRKREKFAHDICLKKIEDLKLEMQLVSTEYAFDGSKILFFFTADGRVDFRELVKNLASVLRTRIELRQIGVRDKAKMVGGLGICGRPFCCREFLDDFQPVSIKMAKTQNLSLNPTKISGTCGRLMCCLNYEQAAYEDLIKTSPKAESFVDTPDGRGTVTEVNLLKQSVNVRLEKQPDTVVCHHNCDICILRNGKAKKTDAPIPDDLAPISGNAPKKKKEEGPAFSTYLEPVVLKRSAETIAAPVTAPISEEESQSKPRRRHANRNGKPKAEAPQEKTAKEQKAEPTKDGKQRRSPKPPKQERGEKPDGGKKAPEEKRPEKPKKQGGPNPKKDGRPRPAPAKEEGEAPAKPKRNRYPYQRRRKPGKKAEE